MDIIFIIVSLLLIASIVVAWLVIRQHRKKRFNPLNVHPYCDADWVIFYATQRGRAKSIAEQTLIQLQQKGANAHMIGLDKIRPDHLIGVQNCLFITSTFGSGQSPEMCRVFERQLTKKHFQNLSLNSLNYALLALGDKNFDRFCGFGRKLGRWLNARGANELKPILLVDQMDKQALQDWKNWIDENSI